MGEINALDVDNVDFNNNIIRVRRTLTKNEFDKTVLGKTTKTNHGERDIVMDNQMRFILKDLWKTITKKIKTHYFL